MFSELVSIIFSQDFLSSSLRLATPLLIATMGSIFSERSGVLFLGLEGFLLIGAFFGFVGGMTYGPWVGILFAIGVNLVIGLIYAFITVTLAVNQVVVCVSINILGLGLTGALLRTIFGTTTSQLQSPRFLPIEIPVLSQLPIIGVIFNQTLLTYIGIIMVPVVFIIFFRTNWGLKIRAVGEHPRAAESMGVNVSRIRYISILWAATFVAIGGAATTIGDIGYFTENITAGRGFIAFAAVILGRFHPIGTLITVVFFGMVDAFQLNLQASGVPIPYQFPLMLPYFLTLIAFLIAGSGVAPKAWGTPYIAEE